MVHPWLTARTTTATTCHFRITINPILGGGVRGQGCAPSYVSTRRGQTYAYPHAKNKDTAVGRWKIKVTKHTGNGLTPQQRTALVPEEEGYWTGLNDVRTHRKGKSASQRLHAAHTML